MTGPPLDADVVVVGAGPAGSVTALLLARRGWRVVVVDRARFPRTKACGECVNPGAVRRLEAWGLDADALGLAPVLLRGWTLGTAANALRPAPFPDDVGAGWGIERSVLDAALLSAARRAGVQVREGTRVRAVHTTGPAPRVEFDGGSLSARCIVGADGLRSRVARSVARVRPGPAAPRVSQTVRVRGVALPDDRGHLVMGRRATVGLAPVGGGVWNLTRVVPSARAAAVARRPVDLVAAATRIVPGLGGARPDGELRASGPFHWRVSPVATRGVVLVGDAAGYFDPLTGQGIHRALASAEAAADAIDAALARSAVPTATDFASYRHRLRRQRQPGLWLQRWIERLLDHPRLLHAALRRLDRAGTLPDVVAVTGDARPLSSLATLRHLGRPPHRPGWPA